MFYLLHAIKLGYKIAKYRAVHAAPKVVCCMAKPALFGGTELQLELVSSRLKEEGFGGAVLTSGRVANGALAGLERSFVSHLPMGSIRGNRLMAYFFRKLGAKVLQIFNPGAARLIPAAKRAGMQVVYVETGLPARESKWWSPLLPHVEQIDFLISVSQMGLNRFVELFDYQGPSVVIPSLTIPFPEGLRAREPSIDRFRVIYFGRVCRGKGLEVLLKAYAGLKAVFPFAELAIAGDGPLLGDLRAGNPDVQFLGRLERCELLEELVQSDVCCLPSFSEGLPCSILEAMSLRLPVVATAVGGIPELIDVLLVPPGDVEALAEGLKKMAGSINLRKELAEKAYVRYKRDFAPEAAMEKMVSVVFKNKFDILGDKG